MSARLAAAALVLSMSFPMAAWADWSRDPFMFGAGQGESAAPPRLEMILIKGGERIAVFSGERLRPGDAVEGYVIVEITLDQVVARKGALEKVYRLE